MNTETSDPHIYVKAFTRPGEADSARGIRLAIQEAIRTGSARLVFEPGRYVLDSSVFFKTAGMLHDHGSGANRNGKDVHIGVAGSTDLRLCGAVDAKGQPATLLVGKNDRTVHGLLPAILWCENNRNLTLENIGFTREPAFASAAEVVHVHDDAVSVKLLDGIPEAEGQEAYCMNRFDRGGNLTGESVTYGGGAGARWKRKGSLYTLKAAAVAAKVHLGEFLSWHQGAQTDFQVYFGHIQHLSLRNLRTYNCNGFAFLAEQCRHIKADNIVFAPDGNRLFTGPRDAWKLFKCQGEIHIRGLNVRGVRMDGQNVHSNWLTLQQKTSPRTCLCYAPYTYAPIVAGSRLEYYEGFEKKSVLVVGAEHAGPHDNGQRYAITLAEPLTETQTKGALLAATCWEPDAYTCVQSKFINIAGAGHLLRTDNVLLEENEYRNTMNPGILLGAELPTHREGGHATHVVIRNSVFENCGFFPRYTAGGCIGVKSSGFDGPYNTDILIEDNLFRHAKTGLHLLDAGRVTERRNRYEHIASPVLHT